MRSTTTVQVYSIGTTDLPKIARDQAKAQGCKSPVVQSWKDIDPAEPERKPARRLYEVTLDYKP